jgi:hypothetical protein
MNTADMSLKGQTIILILSDPSSLKGRNLYGTILSDRGGDRLKVKLSKPLKGYSMTSDLIELTPAIDKGRFKQLSQYYSVRVKGVLFENDRTDTNFFVLGTVTLD